MISSSLSSLHPVIKLIIVLLLAIILVNILHPVAIIAGAPFFDIKIRDAVDAVFNNIQIGGIAFLKYQQAADSIILFMLTSVIAAYLFSVNFPKYLSLHKTTRIFSFLLGMTALIVGIPFLAYMVKVNSIIPVPAFLEGLESKTKQVDELMQRMLDMKGTSDYITNILVIGFIASIAEEFFFRGLIQKLLCNWTKNIHAGIILTAIFFSIMHFQISGMITRLILGLFLGYLLAWSGSLWLPVLVHIFNNSMIITVIYTSDYDYYNAPLDPFTWWTAVISLTASLVVLYVLKRYEIVKSANSAIYRP